MAVGIDTRRNDAGRRRIGSGGGTRRCSFGRSRGKVFIFRVLETGILTTKSEQHIAYSTITMLGYDDFSLSAQIATGFVLKDFVVFRSMDKQHHVGILLNGTGLTQVGKLGAFVAALTIFHATVEL